MGRLYCDVHFHDSTLRFSTLEKGAALCLRPEKALM